MPDPTHELTIYRLSDAVTDVDAFLETSQGTYLDEAASSDMVFPEYPDVGAVAFHWQRGHVPVPWLKPATHLIGELPQYETADCGALLLLDVNGERYAIGFGGGWRSIPEQFKDHRFGLSFAIRAVDAEQVRTVVRRSMSGLGRQDATHVPSGIPIGHIGLSEYTEIVGRLAGMVEPGDLGLDRTRALRVEGSAGLRLRIPLDRDRLVVLLRRISEICARTVPDDFAFVEAVAPVRDEWRLDDLDKRLEVRLRAATDDDEDVRLATAVPLDLADLAHEAQSHVIKIGAAESQCRGELDLDAVLRRCRLQCRCTAVRALRRGEVRMCEDERGQRVLGRAAADKWLAASVRVGESEYFLVEGAWYEGGAEFFASVRRRIAGLFRPVPSLVLPPWRDGLKPLPGSKKRGEAVYNEWVQDSLGADRFLNLDRTNARTEFHGAQGFEPCDLLGPHDELVHVKGGKGTEPFSHMFSQALVSAEALYLRAEARASFADLVRKTSLGTRNLPDGWRPTKVVLAMKLNRQTPLTPTTLFPNAQIALAHLTRTLARYGIEVEVIAISRGNAPAGAA
ncbi:TIGR04141 family sporadically distributed protein [Actinomadura meridiana]|uniref:TIGR04141 family sporadically distributed protein n=1 Tax=Actinomadura meridiana TaxID=559626 RepID=A0ABP8CMV8_9ACTN